ncbi:MAG: DUF285 domain-containing protein [Lactobacillaceae bacterium]|nr:DUF285 domain-containing protein [Lactobacillaceae bacterium]
MAEFKLCKKMAQALALLAVIVGGAVAPMAGVVIPGLQQSVAYADADSYYGTTHYTISGGILTLDGGELPNDSGGGNSPWYYDTSITKVVISGTVKAASDSITLFQGLSNVTKFVGLENLNTSSVYAANYMFYGCTSLESLDISSFDTTVWAYTYGMFEGCSNLKTLLLPDFNTRHIYYMQQMFAGCSSLETLDLTGMKTTAATSQMAWAFDGCTSLWKITFGPDFWFVGSYNGLPGPSEGTVFDGGYTTFSSQWREVGTGTDHAPNGDEVSGGNIPGYQNAHTGETHTYVWQGIRPPDGQTNVDYTVEPSYTITIPASITIANDTKKGSGNVVLGEYPKLPYDESLITIGVTSANWKLTNAPHDTAGVAYLFGTEDGDDDLSTGDTFAFTADGTDDESQVQTVYATLPSGSQFKYAGTYTDTVNYTISTGEPNA